jgi:alpha-ketoglutarate-dependent 2,4-dichlorophenoxyacetate dioxygenase
MNLTIKPLTSRFGALVSGVDIGRAVPDDTFRQIRDAFEHHSVLVFPDQPMDDARQIEWSERFGPLERTVPSNPAAGSAFARQSNIDIKTGETIPVNDRRMLYQKANMLWHADSTFKETQSLCSILSAREVPPAGGATEFASTRSVYDDLPASLQQDIEDLEVEHDLVYSRRIVGFEFAEAEAAAMPAARHPLVQINSVTGRKSVLIGAHAKCIVGWPENRSRELLDDLLARTTRSENCFRHDWRTNDVVIWDNRSVLHRATPYDAATYRRLMQRTTVSLVKQAAVPH